MVALASADRTLRLPPPASSPSAERTLRLPSPASPFSPDSPASRATAVRPGSSGGLPSGGTSPKNGALSATGRALVRAQSAGSLGRGGNLQHGTGKSTQSMSETLWSTKWRPAPAHLVEEWHALGTTAKGAVVQAREDLQRGEANAYLGNCSLGNAGAFLVAEVLQGSRLRTLGLQTNRIGDGGAMQLAEALEPITGLEVVCLSYNNIGDEGASRIAKLVERHGGLKLLSLDRNNVRDVGATRLVMALGKNPRRSIEVVLAFNPVRRLGPRALESLAAVAASVQRLSERGVTLMTLLRIYTDGVAEGTIRPRHTSTGEVVQQLLLPACEVAMKSYVEALSPENPPPMTQVIHAWDALFEDLVRAVASHACGQRSVEVLDPSHHQWCYSPEWTGKSYFIDCFCVNQHAHTNVRAHRELARFAEHPRFSLGDVNCQVDRLDLVSCKIVQRGGRLLVVVDNDNLLLTRVHCLYEMHQAIQDEMPIDVIFSGVRLLPRDRRAHLIQKAEASINQTRQMIVESVRDSPGGYDRFNQVVLEFIDRHVDREFNAVLDQFDAKPY